MAALYHRWPRRRKGSASAGTSKRRASDRIGYFVVHHHDFDGFLCAVLFRLRIAPFLGIPDSLCVYKHATYGSPVDIAKVTADVKKKLDVDDVRIVLLDVTDEVITGGDPPFLIIDHHNWEPHGSLVIHDPDVPSCAELIDKTFKVPGALESPPHTLKALLAARSIDTGGADGGRDLLMRVLQEAPGCMNFHIERMSHTAAVDLLTGYIMNDSTEAELARFLALAEQNRRILTHEAKPRKTDTVAGKTVAWFHFGGTPAEYMAYRIAIAQEFDKYDFTIFSIEPPDGSPRAPDGALKVRFSIRSTIKDFDMAALCRQFGGGGRKWGAGGFDVMTKRPGEYMDMITFSIAQMLAG